MDQFSHDLTVALEETSLLTRVGVSWGQRRRTLSTGNLPSAPQPTEDSSSSPTDACVAVARPLHAANKNPDGLDTNSALLQLSDSDEKDELALRFPCKPFNTTKTAIQRLATLESDSLNENFSPARFFKPITRRKRKLKRMSVEYDVASANAAAVAAVAAPSSSYFMETTFPSAPNNTIRKRGLKTDVSAHRSNNLFFCGKRKRSNRDKYHEHAENGFTSVGRASGGGLLSCSMPRYNNWDEYRGMRPRSFSSTSKPHSERCLLPLNKGLISKIERIAQLQKTDDKVLISPTTMTDAAAAVRPTIETKTITAASMSGIEKQPQIPTLLLNNNNNNNNNNVNNKNNVVVEDSALESEMNEQQLPLTPIPIKTTTAKAKPTRIEMNPQTKIATSTLTNQVAAAANSDNKSTNPSVFQGRRGTGGGGSGVATINSSGSSSCNKSQQKSHRGGGSRRSRSQLQQQLQFAVDQYSMDCSELNDFSSSSSLSSSDTDDGHTANGTDREGDDELTDWPGNNEFGGGGMALDFKRKLIKKSQLPLIRSDEMDGESSMISGIEWSSEVLDAEAQQDTLEMRYQPSDPITISQRGFGFGGNISFGSGSGSRAGLSETGLSGGACHSTELSSHEHEMSIIPIKQIESEMSGETSTNFLSSPPCKVTEVREIRAGCRRVKGERPAFSIKTSVNERLARFLQEPRQAQIRLPDIEIYEQESLISLATLYSLQMTQDNGCVVLTKTSNTTQPVNMEQQSLQGHLFLSDFKRRCYDSHSSNFVPPNA